MRRFLCLYSGYNPPKFALDAAKEALDKVDCNQYSPTKVLSPLRIDTGFLELGLISP
jgi:hypothetical protein